MRIICSGGGTGGHIYPAIAVAEEILKRNPKASILFIGALGKMEMEKVPKAGFPIKGLWISGFQRRLTYKNILFPVKLIVSIVHAYGILRAFKPDVVIGFGGYASGATLLVASWMGIRTIIQEQNSYPGVTNKILGPRVDKICIAYEEAEKYFKAKGKVIWTGNPVRNSLMIPENKASACAYFGLDPDKKTVLIIGGSLGAKSINEALKWSFDAWKDEHTIQILWQCGKLYYEDYKVCNTANLPFVHISAFIDNMNKAYWASDLVVSRAGAITVSELAVAARPAILVPSPNVAEDHQTENARALVSKNAAVLITDRDLAKNLHPKVKALLGDEDKLKALSVNIKEFGKPEAVSVITNEIFEMMEKS